MQIDCLDDIEWLSYVLFELCKLINVIIAALIACYLLAFAFDSGWARFAKGETLEEDRNYFINNNFNRYIPQQKTEVNIL